MKKIRIGARDTSLGRWQGGYAKAAFEEIGLAAELVLLPCPIGQTELDKAPANEHFANAAAVALRCGEVDVAVHALNDLPTTPPDGIAIGGLSYREDASDWLLIRLSELANNQLFSLKNNAVVGSSDPHRKAQLFGYRPDIGFAEVPGDVPTQLGQLRNGSFDALLVAAADLARLHLETDGLEIVKLNVREFVPAPGQGVLAYQCCADDLETRRSLQRIHQPLVAAVTNIERKVLRLLGGDAQLPLGVFCEMDASGNYHAWAALADAWGQPVRRVRLSQSTHLGLAERIVAGLD